MEALHIENLSFKYMLGEDDVLANVNLRVEPGEKVLLLGASGSGKSTLLKLMDPLIAPKGRKSGRIMIGDREVGEISDREAAAMIAYVGQNPESQIITDTALGELAFAPENLSVDPAEIRRRIAWVTAYFGIESWMDRRTDELSGGQKQLLNLASAMMKKPQLLLLDEPTSYLDPLTARRFLDMVDEMNRDFRLSVIIAEHRPDKLAGRIHRAYIFNGRTLAEHGTDFAVEGPDLFYENLFRINEKRAAEGTGGASPRKAGSSGNTGRPGDGENPVNKNRSGDVGIDIREICFRFSKTDKDVLKDLSLKVRQGDVYGLLGGNGAGKTTLLRCIAGGLKPYRGRITGTENRGLLPQNPRSVFVHETVGKDFDKFFEYRGLSRDEAQKELEAIRSILPIEGLEDKNTYDLSGGETEICAIAKILMSGASVLLFDEPTKGLDVDEKRRLRDIFRRLGEDGRIVIFVTHDEEFTLMAANRVGVLSGGRILE